MNVHIPSGVVVLNRPGYLYATTDSVAWPGQVAYVGSSSAPNSTIRNEEFQSFVEHLPNLQSYAYWQRN